MGNIKKYGFIGIILLLIILGFLIIDNVTSNVEGNIIEKIVNLQSINSNNISENITGTVYQYGNSKISYVKSDNVEPFIAQIKNSSDLQKINLNNIPHNSIAFKTNDEQYALLIVKSDKSEAVFIKSPTQEELIMAGKKINTGDEILNQITNKLDSIKINTNQISLNNLPI